MLSYCLRSEEKPQVTAAEASVWPAEGGRGAVVSRWAFLQQQEEGSEERRRIRGDLPLRREVLATRPPQMEDRRASS